MTKLGKFLAQHYATWTRKELRWCWRCRSAVGIVPAGGAYVCCGCLEQLKAECP